MRSIVRFFVLQLWHNGVELDCDGIADVDNGSGECIVPIGSDICGLNVRIDLGLILSHFLNYYIKGIKNRWQCIVEIIDT